VTIAKREKREIKKKTKMFSEPNHRCGVDLIVAEGSKDDVEIKGWFKYGPSAAPIGLTIEIFIQEPDSYLYFGKWKSFGITETTKGGIATFKVPRNVVSGRTRVHMVVLNDFTVARGCVWVLSKNTQAVIFDLDGTISTHDVELIKALFAEPLKVHYDGEERNGARLCVNQWWAKGYLPIYLSGRAGSYYELTLKWLEAHNFPPGIVGHTLDSVPTLPIYRVVGSERLGVGTFKEKYLANLRNKYEIQYKAAYGNTTTDEKVYKWLGLKAEQIFMLSGGKKNQIFKIIK
jgi:hypothetical protein